MSRNKHQNLHPYLPIKNRNLNFFVKSVFDCNTSNEIPNFVYEFQLSFVHNSAAIMIQTYFNEPTIGITLFNQLTLSKLKNTDFEKVWIFIVWIQFKNRRFVSFLKKIIWLFSNGYVHILNLYERLYGINTRKNWKNTKICILDK
jgi:hypothetical protein